MRSASGHQGKNERKQKQWCIGGFFYHYFTSRNLCLPIFCRTFYGNF